MKKFISVLATIVCPLSLMAQAPAFPGAEGHGRFVTGGRGGKIIHVTNLNDSGPGSLRSAVSGGTAKTIVFDVGGVIALKSNLKIGANTTIAGQTAPFPGITLRYYTVSPDANNVIVRFIRVRRGQEKDVNDGADAIWTRHYTGQIYDHCSFSWSIDEVASFYDNNNFTMQWCTIAESLNEAGHGKGAHGYGGIWGGKLASFHHNLIAHVNNRSPRFNGARYNWTGYTNNKRYSEFQWKNAVQAENVDLRNCVIYNCGNGCYGGPGGGKINMVNNYFKTGPAASTSRITTVSVGSSGNSSGYPTYWDMTSRYYISGNQVNNNANYDWRGVTFDSGVFTINGETYSLDTKHYNGEDVEYVKNSAGNDCVRIKLDEPTVTGDVTTHSATTAFDKVLAYAGASLDRDEVDARYAVETKNGTATYSGSVTKKKGRIDVVSDVNGYTEANFGTGARPEGFDTDNDGMPDAWETANGLNPNDATDAISYTLDSKNYYTNLEVYLNSIVQDIMLAGNSDALETVDEYYPAYTKEDGTVVPAFGGGNPAPNPDDDGGVPVTYMLAQSTNTGSNTTSEYLFNDDLSITNTNEKKYATGSEDGIKYSAGVQYTIVLPAGVSISKATFTGYDNYAETDAYLGEVAGVQYDSNKYVFPQKQDNNYVLTSNTVDLVPAVNGKLTFTPMGKQVVLAINLSGKKKTDGISTVFSDRQVGVIYYNLQGQRVEAPGKGVFIRVETSAEGKRMAQKVLFK